MKIEEALKQAIAQHQAGQFQDAERIYREILQAQPNHPDANHNLGVLAIQVKQPVAGLPHLKMALETNPNQGQYWLSYIEGLIQTGQTDAARQVLEQGRQRGLQGVVADALAERLNSSIQAPEQSKEAYEESSQKSPPALTTSLKKSKKNNPHKTHPNPQEINALLLLFNQGKFQEAAVLARTMTERFPLHGFAWGVLGAVFKMSGRNAEALIPLQKAVEYSPGDAGALYNLGIILNDLGRLSEAETNYRRALKIKPHFAEAHNNLANTLKNLGRPEEAEACYRQALLIKPDYPEAHNNLGNILQESGRTAEAEASYRQVLLIKPDYPEAYNNLGNILQESGRTAEAEASYRQALLIKPDYAEAHNNLGNILQNSRRPEEAEASYRKAIQIKPDFAEAYANLGNVLKMNNRLDEVLANYRLSLNAKGDWKESLHRLTRPLILDTGMVLGPQYEKNRSDTNHQTHCPPEQIAIGTPLITGTEDQGSEFQETGQSNQTVVKKKLRIILIYPPPWQIPSSGDPISGMPFGPPKDRLTRILEDGDFQTITYGLLTIAAQAKRAGYDTTVYNLSICPWRDVVELIAETKADIYGISAFTANRRGMGAMAALIRQYHPDAHIMAGGPFVTALPLDTLRYYRAIDTAVIGEGEETFMDLLKCLESGRTATGIPGTAYRNGEDIALGPARPRIKDLDALASPFDYFTSLIVMTSRGCPNKCSFCGSFITWGKVLRFHSAESCLDIFKKALSRLSVPFIAIKDDTFTAHRRRTIAICDTIIKDKMNFLWSCDSRVDSLDDELLYKMRMAGCQMISLGVESGSPEILKTIRKETTPDMILEATRIAKKYGMYVRYYMIYGNRGETPETIQQSNQLIKSGRPNRYVSSPLSFFPGTEDWAFLCETQGITPDIFFRNDFTELSIATNRTKELQHVMLHVTCDIGAVHGFDYTIEEREAVVDRLPNLHIAHVELANAYYRGGRLDDAESALNRAEKLNFPITALIFNQQACIALARGNVDKALTLLEHASRFVPNQIVMNNMKTLRAWADTPVNRRAELPVLNDSVDAIDFCTPFITNQKMVIM
jgi:radical SAM superfamily enzyme YgiQ (UPF0313 family)/Flp pilus assembly protein TadD